MEFKLNLYRLREGRDMKPTTFANLVSTSLYEKRFSNYFVTPIVIGVEEGKAVICTYDSIGAMDKDNFAVGGTGAEFFYGCCESFYKPNIKKEELEEVLA
jgi:20S proteasome subunit beta 3